MSFRSWYRKPVVCHFSVTGSDYSVDSFSNFSKFSEKDLDKYLSRTLHTGSQPVVSDFHCHHWSKGGQVPLPMWKVFNSRNSLFGNYWLTTITINTFNMKLSIFKKLTGLGILVSLKMYLSLSSLLMCVCVYTVWLCVYHVICMEVRGWFLWSWFLFFHFMEALGIELTFSGFHGKYLHLLSYPPLPCLLILKKIIPLLLFLLCGTWSLLQMSISFLFMK